MENGTAEGIRLKYHQVHNPLSILTNLLIYVCMVFVQQISPPGTCDVSNAGPAVCLVCEALPFGPESVPLPSVRVQFLPPRFYFQITWNEAS